MTVIKYEVIDRQTGSRVGGLLKSRKTSTSKVDRLDNNYGGYRYFKREVEVNE